MQASVHLVITINAYTMKKEKLFHLNSSSSLLFATPQKITNKKAVCFKKA